MSELFYGKELVHTSTGEWADISNEYIPHFMWYRWDGKRKLGWCSKCGCLTGIDKGESDIYSNAHEFLSTKHGEYGECPCCLHLVTFIAEGRMTNYNSLQSVRRLIFSDYLDYNHVRFYAVKVYNYPDRDEVMQFIDFEPVAYYEMQPGSVRMERYRKGEWQEVKQPHEPFNTFYGRGGDYELAMIGYDYCFDDTFLQYSRVDDFAIHVQPLKNHNGYNDVFTMTYLSQYCLHLQLEFLMKAGAYGFVQDLVYLGKKNALLLNWKAQSFADFFRIPKRYLKDYLATNCNPKLLAVYRDIRKNGDCDFGALCRQFKLFGSSAITYVYTFCQLYNVGVDRLTRYLQDQAKQNTRSSVICPLNEIWLIFKDYIDTAKELGFDLAVHNVLLPKNLFEAHDTAQTYLVMKQDKEMLRKSRQILKGFEQKYVFENEEFFISIPKYPSQFIEESAQQSNCVKGYSDRHFKGKLCICFLREKSRPGDSFMTIEMNGNFCRQVLGYHNYDFSGESKYSECKATDPLLQAYLNKPRERANAFFQSWLSWVEQGSKRDPSGKPILKSMSKEAIIA